MGVLQLMAADETTVLFDFHDPTGAANPNTLATKLSGALNLGTTGSEIAVFRNGSRSVVTDISEPPVEFTLNLLASATTYQNLVDALGQLAEWLHDPPGPLKWTQGTARFIDLLGAPTLPALFRGQNLAAIVASRKSSLGPIPIGLLRQPYMRAVAVSTTPTAVPNDPSSAGGRLLSVTIGGDLPTPVAVKSQMGTGAAVAQVLVGHKKVTSTQSADLISDTAWANLDVSARGWTVTLGTDTSSVANASGVGSNVARVSYATNATNMTRRVRLTRTTKLDSLVGDWDVWVRFAATAASRHELSFRHGISTADPVAFRGADYVHDVSTATSFGFVERKLGSIHVPEGVTLGGLALELWSRRVSGTGNLDLDIVFLVPRSYALIVAPSSEGTAVLGSDLTTPPAVITGDPTWVAGSVSGSAMRLNAVNEGAGMGPNAGEVWGTGRHVVGFRHGGSGGTVTLKYRVVNVTDNTEVASRSSANLISAGTIWRYLSFDGVAGKAYQPQVVLTAVTGSPTYDVFEIKRQVLPYLAANEHLRTDPGARYAVDRLDSSGNLSGSLTPEGEIPFIAEPGTQLLFLRPDDVPILGYTEEQNVKARTQTVTLTYAERYAL